MADALVRHRLPFLLHSQSCSASIPTRLDSFCLNSLHLGKKLQSPSLVDTAEASFKFRPRKKIVSIKARGSAVESESPKWWEKDGSPNMIDIHSTQEFLTALSQAGDKLVIVEFYGTWCASCRALFPKLCSTAKQHTEILFLKVDFDANKQMCKGLNVKVLPYFHFYRGADGQLESFSCSLAKFQKIKDAIQQHGTDRCSIGPNKGVGDLSLELASS